MRVTANVDEKLIDRARELSGIENKTALLNKALEALISWEAAKRLADLGGSEPQLKVPPRRRSAI